MKNPFATAADFQDWMSSEWAGSLRQALESLIGVPIDVAKGRVADTSIDGSAFLWWQQKITGAEQSPLSVGAPQATWNQLAQGVLAAAGLDGASDDEARQTYFEILQQAFSAWMGATAATIGREVTNASAGPIATAIPHPWIQFDIGGDINSAIYLAFPDSLREIGRTESDENTSIAPVALTGDAAAQIIPMPPNMEVLYDVEMPISISFGRAKLPLKEVLKLTSGSIVELNRTVSEPVDVVVNNCVIARAEVVVVEGNYGVKIIQIITPNERLKFAR